MICCEYYHKVKSYATLFLHTHRVLWAVACPLTLTTIAISQRVLKHKFLYASQRPFLSLAQQHQSTETGQ